MEIAAAIISVTEAAMRASSKIWKLSEAWRDAPVEIHNLRDDLARTERFFGEIQERVKTAQVRGFASCWEKDSEGVSIRRSSFTAPEDPSGLSRMVDEGAVTLRRIEAIVDSLTMVGSLERVRPEKVELGKRRKFLWLRHSRKVNRLRKELAQIRSSICRLLIAQNMTISSEICDTLEQSQHDLRSRLGDLSTTFNTSQDQIIAQLDNRIQAMESKMLVAIHQSQSQSHHYPLLPKTTTPSLAPTHHHRHYHDTVDKHHYSPQPLPPSPPPYSACSPTCQCECHHVSLPSQRLYRLTLFPSVVGLLAVAYYYRTNRSSSCSTPSCSHVNSCQGTQQQQTLQILYHLPPWLSRLSLSALIVSTSTSSYPSSPMLNNLSFSLRIYYRRSPSESQAPSGVGRLIDQGDVPGLRTALATGKASVYDLYCKGMTGLALGVHVRRVGIVHAFLQAGADPFHQDDEGGSVVEVAFSMWLANRPRCGGEGYRDCYYGDATEREIGELFERGGYIGRYLEEGGFGVLHRAVVAGDRDLGGLLAGGKGEGIIDERNAAGLTPLHLAATKGDARAAKLLITAGAEVDIQTGSGGRGSTPLWSACRYGHVEVVKVLLAGGADVTAKDWTGRQAVHIAAVSSQAKRVVQVLLKHGADVNAWGGVYGYTPLTFAVVWGPLDVVDFLLDEGADINSATIPGQTMIMMALSVARHEKARLLLRRGASLAGVDSTGRNVLHFLALNGDQEMMDIFAETKQWRGWTGVLAKDNTGMTPLGLLNARKPSDDLRDAFHRLLDWIDMCGEEGEESEDDDFSEDEFYDAVEWLR